MMYKVEVHVTLKKTVADPQGLTIKHALESLGFKEVLDARIGKFITLDVDVDTEAELKQKVDQMCAKLLANPIIEDYSFNYKKEV